LIEPTAHGIASRILGKADGGSLTLFAFDAGEGLSAHTSPFEAFVMVLEGALTLTVGDVPVQATPGTIVALPANVPHSVDAIGASRMLLMMLKNRPGA
jgi:quercetin dioxygenase-like cupin family protein